MYNPVGVLSAREMSAWGRRVRVGFWGELVGVEETDVVVPGGLRLRDVLKSGHSIIARESALISRGRMVKRLYCREVSFSTWAGNTGDEAESIECGETGPNTGGEGSKDRGMCALSIGKAVTRDVRSRAVEYPKWGISRL